MRSARPALPTVRTEDLVNNREPVVHVAPTAPRPSGGSRHRWRCPRCPATTAGHLEPQTVPTSDSSDGSATLMERPASAVRWSTACCALLATVTRARASVRRMLSQWAR